VATDPVRSAPAHTAGHRLTLDGITHRFGEFTAVSGLIVMATIVLMILAERFAGLSRQLSKQ
jgi:hypothetical protein